MEMRKRRHGMTEIDGGFRQILYLCIMWNTRLDDLKSVMMSTLLFC